MMTLFSINTCFAVTDVSDPYDDYRQKSDYDESLEVPWTELEVEVKHLPANKDLSLLDVRTLPSGLSLSADFENIKVSDHDYVSRFWLVIRSESGAYNGSYEGFRCETNEYKVYAYGNPKNRKPVRVLNVPRWKPIPFGNYRIELMLDYICDGISPRSAENARASIARDFTEDRPLEDLTNF